MTTRGLDDDDENEMSTTPVHALGSRETMKAAPREGCKIAPAREGGHVLKECTPGLLVLIKKIRIIRGCADIGLRVAVPWPRPVLVIRLALGGPRSLLIRIRIILILADRQPVRATNAPKVVDALGDSETASTNVAIAPLRRITVIEIQRTKTKRRSLGPADGGRITIGARQEVITTVCDLVYKEPLLGARERHSEYRLILQHNVDSASSSMDKAPLLVEVPGESNHHTGRNE